MRPAAWFVALAATVVLLAASPVSGIPASTASPIASPAALPPLVVAYGEAWSSRDPTRVTALYAGDALFEEVVAGGAVTHGHGELSAYLAELFAAFPDFALTPTTGFVAGDRAAVEWTVTGTYRGQFGALPPGAGQNITIRGASILDVEGGKIVRDREYWDAATLLTQVGALPTPGGATPDAAASSS